MFFKEATLKKIEQINGSRSAGRIDQNGTYDENQAQYEFFL